MTHTKQLLLVTFCDTTAGIGARFWKHGRTHYRKIERHEVGNSYLDLIFFLVIINLNHMLLPIFEQNELSPLNSNLLFKDTKC